jgi:hypothetical protein
MAIIVLLGIHWSTFFTKDSFMNMLRLLVSSIGRISLTVSTAPPLGWKYNLYPCDWCWTEFLSLYSSIIFAFLWNYLSNLRGIHVQLVQQSVAELCLRIERVSMSNMMRLFAFAVLMIALQRGVFGSSSKSSTRSPWDEDTLVWAQILFL